MFNSLRRVQPSSASLFTRRVSEGLLLHRNLPNRSLDLKQRTLLSTAPRSRLEALRTKVYERYPDISAKDLPSITASFLILHEITAILPLIISFFILQSTGLGDSIVDWVETHSEIKSLDDDEGDKWLYLRSKMRSAFQQGSLKIRKIGQKYGWVSHSETISAPVTENGGDMALSRGFLVNGLAAYLIVKTLLPFRIAVSLYFAPFVAKSMSNGLFALLKRISSKSR